MITFKSDKNHYLKWAIYYCISYTLFHALSTNARWKQPYISHVLSNIVLWRQHGWHEAYTWHLKTHTDIDAYHAYVLLQVANVVWIWISYPVSTTLSIQHWIVWRVNVGTPRIPTNINTPTLNCSLEATLEDVANYCRTPDGREWPWCFTTSSEVRSELCHFDVTCCASGEPPGNAFDCDEQCHLARCKTTLWNTG